MLTLVRVQNTNLFILNGLQQSPARFAFVANPNAVGNSLPWNEQLFADGFFIFFPETAATPHPFLNAAFGSELWTIFTNTAGVKIGWMVKPGLNFRYALAFDVNRKLQSNAEFQFGNYSLVVPSGSQLGFGNDGFTFSGRPTFRRNTAAQTFVAPTPAGMQSFDLALADGLRPISAFRFPVEFQSRGGVLSDFDRLDAALMYFDRQEGKYVHRRFAVFHPMEDAQPTELTTFLDPLHVWDNQQTYLSFTSPVVSTHFRTTFGLTACLAPIPTAVMSLERARLVFQPRLDRPDQELNDFNSPRYLTPAGRFTLKTTTTSPGSTEEVAPDIAIRLLCGNSGTEYVLSRYGDIVSFLPDSDACYNVAAGKLTRENGKTTTAWLSLTRSQTNSLAPRYRAQPDEAPLYAPTYEPIASDPDDGSPIHNVGGIFDYQQIPVRSLDGEPFPMAPVFGFRSLDNSASAASDYAFLETQYLYTHRRDLLKPVAVTADPVPLDTQADQPTNDVQSTVTPNGLLAKLQSGSLTMLSLVIAKTEESQKDPTNLAPLQLDSLQNEQEFIDGLKRNKLMLVVSKPLSSATFQNKLGILGWVFQIPLSLLSNGKRSLLIFKFYQGQALTELAKDTSVWVHGQFTDLATAQSALQNWITNVIQNANSEVAANAPIRFYQGIRRRIEDPNWNGVLAVNLELNAKEIPGEIKGLSPGIKLDKFKADHLGVDVNRYTETGALDLVRSSLFALIDYRRETTPTPTKPFEMSVKTIQVLFENSAITQFYAEVELYVERVLKQKTKPGENPVLLKGTYERRGNLDVYSFMTDRRFEFSFDNNFVEKFRITRTQMTTESSRTSNEVVCRFGITGNLALGKTAKYLCVENLNFRDFTVEFKFDINDPGNFSVHPQLGLLRFDMANSKKCESKLLELMPLDLKSFFFNPDELEISLPQIGFIPLSLPSGEAGLPAFDFGLSFNLDLGSLGALSAAIKEFKAEIFVGWKADELTKLLLGIRIPEGRKEFGIQGVLKLIIKNFRMFFDDGTVCGLPHPYYAITMEDCRLELLGKSFPGDNTKFNVFLFPNPQNPFGSKIGWFGGAESGNTFVGLGQRLQLTLPSQEVPSFENIIGELKKVDRDHPCKIQYNAENEWTAAIDFRPISSLRLGVVFNDPTLYALLVELLAGPVKGLKFEVTYRKITDSLGVYYAELTLPAAIREIQLGAASLTLPVFGLEVYTNGNFRVDLGFPANLNFSRSCTVQVLPFIGGGGFYIGKLNGLTSTLLPDSQLSVVAVFGFGLRVGLGKEIEKGIFRAGVSVCLYGILEGALGYENGNSNLISPNAYKLVGRVGILAQIFGSIDFGIVKATVTIVIEVGIPFTFEKPRTGSFSISIPYIEANVDVDVEVEIGRIKIFGKKISITISFSFHVTLRIDLPITGNQRIANTNSFSLALLDSDSASFIEWTTASLNLARLPVSAAKIPLRLRFTIDVTVAAAGGQLLPQLVGMLAIKHGTGGEQQAEFDKLVATLWIAAICCSDPSIISNPTNRLVSLSEMQSILSRLQIPVTLARTTSPDALDYARIRQFLMDNFDITIDGWNDEADDTSHQNHVFFPMIPDLTMEADKEGLITVFRDLNKKTAAYQDALDRLLEQVFVRMQQTSSPVAKDPGPVAFASLAFEQYFDYLISAACQFYTQKLQRLVVPGDVDPTRTIAQLLSDVEGQTFSELAAMVTGNFYSGLSLPDDISHPETLKSFYQLTSQQFAVARGDANYPVRLKNIASETWPVLGTGSKLPEYSDLDTGLLTTYETVAGSWLPNLHQQFTDNGQSTLEALPTVQRHDLRFNFPEGNPWSQQSGTAADRIVWAFPLALRKFLEGLETTPGLDNIKVPLRYSPPNPDFRRSTNADGKLLDAGPAWATLIRLSIRQVSENNSAVDDRKIIPNLYEVGGTPQDQRILLDRLLTETDTFLNGVTISLLYSGGEANLQSDRYRSPNALLDALLYKTRLSTEARPPQIAVAFALTDADTTTADMAVSAPLDGNHNAEFLHLMWQCCIVNNEGYYLRYRCTSGNADPLAGLFAQRDIADLYLLIEYPQPTTAVLAKSYINAATSDTTVEHGTIPLIVPTGESQVVYAKVERTLQNGGTTFAPVGFFKSVVPAGCLGFRARRTRFNAVASDEQRARTALDNLYCRLAYQVVDTPNNWRKFPLTLSLQPVSVNPAMPASSPDPDHWWYQQVLAVTAQPDGTAGNPYVGVGQEAKFKFAFRDIYGNQVENSYLSLPVKLLYHDPIIPLSEWAGLHTRFDVQTVNGQPKLAIDAWFDPFVLRNDADGSVLRNYKSINSQLLDANFRAVARMTLVANSADLPVLPALRSLVGQILNASGSFVQDATTTQGSPLLTNLSDTSHLQAGMIVVSPNLDDGTFVVSIDSSSQVTVSVPALVDGPTETRFCPRVLLAAFDVPASDVTAKDFFLLTAILRLSRDAADDLFPQVDEPWGSHIYEAARSAPDFIAGQPGARKPSQVGGTPAAGSIQKFAIDFEEKLYPNSQFKIAVGTGDFGESTIWVVRLDRLSLSFTGDPVHVAPAPLAVELQTGSFTVTDPVPLQPSPSAPAPVQRRFIDVDLDKTCRQFLTAVELFLEPTVASRLTDFPEGRTALEEVTKAKRTLAGIFPGLLLKPLFDQTSALDMEAAKLDFGQRVLDDLKATYGIDSLFQMQAKARLDLTEQPHGVNLFGQVIGTAVTSIVSEDRALDFATTKLKFRGSGGTQDRAATLTVLADALKNGKKHFDRQFDYEVTHLEYDLRPEQAQGPFVPSRWLAFVFRVRKRILDQSTVFVPLREFPSAPQLLGHKCVPTPFPSGQPISFAHARQWEYRFGYRIEGEEHDNLELTVELNPSSQNSAADSGSMATSDYFAALTNFTHGYPDPVAAMKELRDNSDLSLKRMLAADFQTRVKRVADSFSTMLSFAASDQMTIRLRFDVSEVDDNATRQATVTWDETGNQGHGAWVESLEKKFDARTFAAGKSMTTFENDDSNRGSLRERVLVVTRPANHNPDPPLDGLDVLRFETARGGARLVRNQNLGVDVQHNHVNPSFIYRTAVVSVPDALTARVERTERVELVAVGSVPRALRAHLDAMFADLFGGLSDSRRMRLDVRYGIDLIAQYGTAASVNPLPLDGIAASPARLLPPQDVKVPVDSTVISKLEEAIRTWVTRFKPWTGGDLVFGIVVFAAPHTGEETRSQEDKATLSLTRVVLPLSKVIF